MFNLKPRRPREAGVREAALLRSTGGRRGTAEMVVFIAQRAATADVELLASSQVDDALDRPRHGGRHRFVLDFVRRCASRTLINRWAGWSP
jgi:hypothetical protein